ncbi:MAG: dihydrodipicolinate synthase family protein [Rhodobacterales bacterium]|nr:dihydrodipicolinate synthase family protein [Rhodobacterales bacterium]
MQRGVHAILYAFFDAEERLARAAMRRQVDLCLQARVAGIAALGLATEVAKLTFAERCTLMDWVAEDVARRVPLGFTIYGQSVAEQIAGVRHAETVGADWIILQPPATGSYNAGEYLAFFGRVMQATTLPTAIQNAPQYLGRGLSDDDIQTLRAAHPNFTVIKSEATAADCAKLIQMAGPDFKVFNGRGGQEMLACLDAGCTGFLLAPDLVDYGVRVMDLYDAGDRAGAQALHDQCLPAIGFIMRSIEHLICYGKRLFALRAGLETFDRAPALRPVAAELAALERLARSADPFPAT